MKKYELLLVLPGTLDEAESAAKIEEISSVFKDLALEPVIKPMGKNRLAYPIKQVRYGYFYTVIFKAESEQVKTLESKLRLTRGLLRAVVSLYNKDMEHAENKADFGSSFEERRRPMVEVSEEKKAIEINEEKKVEEKVEVEEVLIEEKESSGKEANEKEEAIEEGSKEQPAKHSEEDIVVKRPKAEKSNLDLKDLDKKLDEILSDDIKI